MSMGYTIHVHAVFECEVPKLPTCWHFSLKNYSISLDWVPNLNLLLKNAAINTQLLAITAVYKLEFHKQGDERKTFHWWIYSLVPVNGWIPVAIYKRPKEFLDEFNGKFKGGGKKKCNSLLNRHTIWWLIAQPVLGSFAKFCPCS